MELSLFNIDNGTIYEGYAESRHWNGWACPWFTKETANKIAEEYNKLDDDFHMVYRQKTDTYEVSGKYMDETEEYKGKDFTVNGEVLHLYPIGNSCWVWDNLQECFTLEEFVYYYLINYTYLGGEEIEEAYDDIVWRRFVLHKPKFIDIPTYIETHIRKEMKKCQK